jgi:hypothetical protein
LRRTTSNLSEGEGKTERRLPAEVSPRGSEMSEETPLRAFEGWSLIDFAWNPSSGLAVTVRSPDEAAVRHITFQPVLFLKTAANQNVSRASEMANNEIYKFQEIKDSRLLSSLREKDKFRYLICSFGRPRRKSWRLPWRRPLADSAEDGYQGNQTISSPGRPCFPRHFVLLSDYVDLEILCAGYAILPAESQDDRGV